VIASNSSWKSEIGHEKIESEEKKSNLIKKGILSLKKLKI